jgi:serine phosphatase RsbU (regulator of sigma subunit)
MTPSTKVFLRHHPARLSRAGPGAGYKNTRQSPSQFGVRRPSKPVFPNPLLGIGFAKTEDNPCVVLGRLNELLRTDFPQGNFVTMIYAVLDFTTGDLSIASAGHPAPLMIIDGSAQVLAIENGLPLGIATSSYPETRLHLEIQSSAVLYSDGVVEAESPGGQEFGIEGLQSCSWLADVTPDNLLDQVETFLHPNLMPDDATMIVIRRISGLLPTLRNRPISA